MCVCVRVRSCVCVCPQEGPGLQRGAAALLSLPRNTTPLIGMASTPRAVARQPAAAVKELVEMGEYEVLKRWLFINERRPQL